MYTCLENKKTFIFVQAPVSEEKGRFGRKGG